MVPTENSAPEIMFSTGEKPHQEYKSVIIATLMLITLRIQPAECPIPLVWSLPRDLNIVYGVVIKMEWDSSLWIGVYKAGDIATITVLPGKFYGQVVYASAANLNNENIFLSRRIEPFAQEDPLWTRNHAVALITVLSKKRLRVWLFCSPNQWMDYIVSGKPTATLDRWCPLMRDMSDGKVSAARIGDKDFYLENSSWWGDRKINVAQLPKLLD